MRTWYKNDTETETQFNKMFDGKLIQSDSLLYPRVKNILEIANHIKQYEFEYSQMHGAYGNLNIISTEKIGRIIKIKYEIFDKIFDAYSFVIPAKNPDIIGAASLIIPGSGENEASHIADRNPSNYQSNILQFTEMISDSYILIKPNHSILAIHNGKKRLSNFAYVNHLLNRGYSYSAHYLVNSLAISKYLNRKYSHIYNFGLSQGGAATLINSLQTNPDVAVIASGYSILMADFSFSAMNQIIIPGYFNMFTEDIYSIMSVQDTKYLFTYGEKERYQYGVEARDKNTQIYFEDLENIKVVSHPNGHVFPLTVIKEYFDDVEKIDSW